ncbi:MAG TPA: TrmH family RNA methyltransferase [Mycobacteriales bacterium]|nr:TrmH family RNA methyltransferase [Mycobacteriales bacterium]
MRISTRNAAFQQWQALLTNRTKRNRSGEFLVHGVRPITLAVEHGWTVRTLIHTADRRLSTWASGLLDAVDAPAVAMSGELLAELAGKPDAEVVAVLALRPDDLGRVTVGPDFLGVAFDRPSDPGNIGAVVRSADAFGAGAVIVTGHAADAYDPKAIRASTGSFFHLPVIRVPSHADVLAANWPAQIIGTDEGGTIPIMEHDLRGPTLLVIGNETRGLSAGWREACDALVSIPIGGAASSLNAANAASIALYEARRQRG